MNTQKIDMILSYLEGEANLQQRQQIMQWIESGQDIPEWEKALDIHAQRVLKKGKQDVLKSEIVDDLYASLQQKLFSKSLPALEKSVPSRKLWYASGWSIAATLAAITMFIGLWYVVIDNQEKQEAPLTTAEIDVSPGRSRAFLKLSDGRIQTLTEGTQGISVGQQILYLDGEQVMTSASEQDNSSLQTLVTPRGGMYQIVLEDGTRVWMNSESSLTYPGKFNNSERRVTLIGEAYFDVVHDRERPFLVETNLQTVKVLGTTFNLNAYPNSSEITSLVTGSVRVTNQKSSRTYQLIPGQQAVIEENSIQVASSSSDVYAWKDGRFVGSGVTLLELLPSIERWYDVTFYWKDQMINSEKGHFSIDRDESLSALLKALSRTYSVEFRIQGKEVYIEP